MRSYKQIAQRARDLQDHEAPSHEQARLNAVLGLVAELASLLSLQLTAPQGIGYMK